MAEKEKPKHYLDPQEFQNEVRRLYREVKSRQYHYTELSDAELKEIGDLLINLNKMNEIQEYILKGYATEDVSYLVNHEKTGEVLILFFGSVFVSLIACIGVTAVGNESSKMIAFIFIGYAIALMSIVLLYIGKAGNNVRLAYRERNYQMNGMLDLLDTVYHEEVSKRKIGTKEEQDPTEQSEEELKRSKNNK